MSHKKVIDETGKVYETLRDAFLANGIQKPSGFFYHTLEVNGKVNTHGKTFTLYTGEQPARNAIPTSEDPILVKLRERYSDEELKAIAAGQGIAKRYIPFPEIHLTGRHHRILVMSDTHIGSIYSPVEWHDVVAEYANDQENKIECILHCGDLVDGLKISRTGTQIYELSEIGFDAQRDKAVELMGRYDRPIYIISGNHDAYFKEYAGANIVKEICNQVENMTYIGHDSADIDVGGCVIRLFHGGDGNCFTEGTEILTKRGWVDFADLKMEDEVATMTKEGHIFEWQKPIEITKQEYSGDVYHFKNRKFDFSVTPNHRLWVKYNQSINKPHEHDLMPQKAHFKYDDKWHGLTAEEIHKSWRKQKWVIPTTPSGYKQTDFTEYVDIPRIEPKNKGMANRMNHFGRVRIEDIAELIAWYVTEGNARKNCVGISQYKKVNPDEYARIVSLAQRLGCNYYAHDKGVVLYGKEIAEYLKDTCGSGSRNKFIPSFIKENNENILRIVLNTCVDGDGWREKRGTGQLGYRSISPRLLTDVAEIATKLGYSTSFRNDVVSLSKIQVEPAMVKRPEVEQYSGMVYCCSVPNELIFVRKNGRCFFSHNSYALSYRLQKLVEAITGGHKPNILLAGHVHKFCYIFERHIHAISVPAMQSQTSYMRAKKLAAHTGFIVLDFDVRDEGICNLAVQYFPFYA